MLPIALTLQILFMYQEDYLYKSLPPLANHLLVALYIGVCAYSFVYFWFEFERIAIYAQGSYTQHDFIVGLLDVPAGDGAVPARPRRPVLDQRHSHRLHDLWAI